MRYLIFCAMIFALCLSSCSSDDTNTSTSQRNVLYVDKNASGLADGSDWTDAFTNIQDALDVTNLNGSSGVIKDEIWVAAGTYTPAGGTVAATFQLKSGIAIYGGFVGNETERTARDIDVNVTKLSGLLPGGLTYAYHVVTGKNNAVLDGFTIQDGKANDTGEIVGSVGGGMYNDGVSPTVRNCIFKNNEAEDSGAGMYNGNNAGPIIESCRFESNTSNFTAGAIYNAQSSPTITNCVFTNNTSASGGGALLNEASSNPELTNCLFYANNGGNVGGAVYNNNSDPIFLNCTFSDNTASTLGASFYNFNASRPVLTNCIVYANKIGVTTTTTTAQEFEDADTSILTASYSLLPEAYTGGSNVYNIFGDPLFTVAGSDFTLQDGSPVIDVGNNTPVTLTEDLAGNPRKVNGSDAGNVVDSIVVDMGCYENQTVAPIVAPIISN